MVPTNKLLKCFPPDFSMHFSFLSTTGSTTFSNSPLPHPLWYNLALGKADYCGGHVLRILEKLICTFSHGNETSIWIQRPKPSPTISCFASTGEGAPWCERFEHTLSSLTNWNSTCISFRVNTKSAVLLSSSTDEKLRAKRLSSLPKITQLVDDGGVPEARTSEHAAHSLSSAYACLSVLTDEVLRKQLAGWTALVNVLHTHHTLKGAAWVAV